jgi:hypothetical protein
LKQAALGLDAVLDGRGDLAFILVVIEHSVEFRLTGELNRSEAPVKVDLHPVEFGLTASSGCTPDAKDLWNGKEQSAVSALQAEMASHDTAIWHIHPLASVWPWRRESQCLKRAAP